MEERELTEYRLGVIEESISEIRKAVQGIHDSLRMLTALEIKHEQTNRALESAIGRIEGIDSRLAIMEKAMPMLELTSKWIRVGVIALSGTVILGALKLVFNV